jgi:hypothetical protein
MMRSLRARRWVLFLVVVAIFTGLAWLVYLSVQDQQRWTAWCIDMGGHVKTETSTYETVAYVDGQAVSQTHKEYTHFCLSGTGGIIDIRQ